jgi:hypothetical protein
MITLTPKYTKHSIHLGVQIYKRNANSGTSGGAWLAVIELDDTFKSLSQVKAYLEYLESISPMEKP